MAKPQDRLYAVAVRIGSDLHLLGRVRRWVKGEYFFAMQRTNVMGRGAPNWDPHASYHRSGQLHVKSHGAQVIVTQLQKPDASFSGTEQLYAMAILPGEPALFPILLDPASYTDIFELPSAHFSPGDSYTLAVNLVSPGFTAIPQLGTSSTKESFRLLRH